jgi:hypothetical protein
MLTLKDITYSAAKYTIAVSLNTQAFQDLFRTSINYGYRATARKVLNFKLIQN